MNKNIIKRCEQNGLRMTEQRRIVAQVLETSEDHPDFKLWYQEWSEGADITLLNDANPAIIPRNHLVEKMITDAVNGDMGLFHDLNAALKTPFQRPNNSIFSLPPNRNEVITKTFCGT